MRDVGLEAFAAETPIMLAHEHGVIAMAPEQRRDLLERKAAIVGPIRMHVKRCPDASQERRLRNV